MNYLLSIKANFAPSALALGMLSIVLSSCSESYHYAAEPTPPNASIAVTTPKTGIYSYEKFLVHAIDGKRAFYTSKTEEGSRFSLLPGKHEIEVSASKRENIIDQGIFVSTKFRINAEARKNYVVRGAFSADKATLWIEDESTQLPVTSKRSVDLKPDIQYRPMFIPL